MRLLSAVIEPTVVAAENTAPMDKTTSIIMAAVMLVALIGAVILFFIGFKGTINELKKDDGAHRVPKKVLIRSTLFLVGALLCLAVTYFANNYKTYYNGDCSLTELIFACLVSILSHFGWIALIPVLLNLFRINSLKRTRDN